MTGGYSIQFNIGDIDWITNINVIQIYWKQLSRLLLVIHSNS